MNHGVYRLRSETLGEIEIPKHRVKAIRSPGIQTAGPQTPSVHDLQEALRQDPQAMNKILSLQDDPLMQSILSDESLMQAIEAGDLGTLLNNPKIRALMGHPTVQDLGRSYGD